MSATVLTAALVLGEFTLASLDQYQTFPVWVVAFDQVTSLDAGVSVQQASNELRLTVSTFVDGQDFDGVWVVNPFNRQFV